MTLEKAHHYITDTFPVKEPTGDLARFEINGGQLAQFQRDGFLAGIDVLDSRQLEEMRGRLEEIVGRLDEFRDDLYEIEADWDARPDEVVLHFLGAWIVDSVFHDLVFNPAVTVPCAQILGLERLRLWHDQVFHKPPHHTGVVPWHQDFSYWTRTSPACHVTMNIVLDDSSEENGCLHFVPGSHRWGLLPQVSFGGEMEAIFEHLSPEERSEFQPVAAPLRAGQATIHHSHTVHGSWSNTTGFPRRAAVLNYMDPETTCADASTPLLAGAPVFGVGDRVEGDLFPIVLDRTSR